MPTFTMLATVIPSLRLRYPASSPQSLPSQSSNTYCSIPKCWCILKISIFHFVWLFSQEFVFEMTSTFQNCCASLLCVFSLSSLFQMKTQPLTLIFLFSLLFRMQRAASSQSTPNFSKIQHHDAVSVLGSTHASWDRKRNSFQAWDWHPFGLCPGKFYPL